MEEKRYVVGLGEVLWDVLPEGKKLGGAPANFAYHAGLFMGSDNTIAISAQGDDRLADSDLSVEDLASAMNLSRVQLYRKVKAITGSSPVELLRSARLNRGYQLLLTTDKTVSEVAYAVSFITPSYFTKCFKDEFGQSPTEMKH